MVDIEQICADALETAAKLGVELNFQPEDAEKLETIIMPKCSAWLADGTITEDRGA